MKITRRQLRQLISEAMFDYRTLKDTDYWYPTLNKDIIPQSMITDPEFKQKISDLSVNSFEQAVELGDSLDAFPSVIDMAGGYESAARKGKNERMRSMGDTITGLIKRLSDYWLYGRFAVGLNDMFWPDFDGQRYIDWNIKRTGIGNAFDIDDAWQSVYELSLDNHLFNVLLAEYDNQFTEEVLDVLKHTNKRWGGGPSMFPNLMRHLKAKFIEFLPKLMDQTFFDDIKTYESDQYGTVVLKYIPKILSVDASKGIATFEELE